MELDREITVVSALAGASTVLGVVLVLTAGPGLTTLGILLVIAAAMLFLLDVKDLLDRRERQHDHPGRAET